MKKTLPYRIVRLLNEAYNQGGIFTQADVGALLSMSNQKVHTLKTEYQKETGTHLHYRGKVYRICRVTFYSQSIFNSNQQFCEIYKKIQ